MRAIYPSLILGGLRWRRIGKVGGRERFIHLLVVFTVHPPLFTFALTLTLARPLGCWGWVGGVVWGEGVLACLAVPSWLAFCSSYLALGASESIAFFSTLLFLSSLILLACLPFVLLLPEFSAGSSSGNDDTIERAEETQAK